MPTEEDEDRKQKKSAAIVKQVGFCMISVNV